MKTTILIQDTFKFQSLDSEEKGTLIMMPEIDNCWPSGPPIYEGSQPGLAWPSKGLQNEGLFFLLKMPDGWAWTNFCKSSNLRVGFDNNRSGPLSFVLFIYYRFILAYIWVYFSMILMYFLYEFLCNSYINFFKNLMWFSCDSIFLREF